MGKAMVLQATISFQLAMPNPAISAAVSADVVKKDAHVSFAMDVNEISTTSCSGGTSSAIDSNSCTQANFFCAKSLFLPMRVTKKTSHKG